MPRDHLTGPVHASRRRNSASAIVRSGDPAALIAMKRIRTRLSRLRMRATSASRRFNQSRTAFVAMWFSNEMSTAYESGIRPGIESNGYEAIRIDQVDHNNKID